MVQELLQLWGLDAEAPWPASSSSPTLPRCSPGIADCIHLCGCMVHSASHACMLRSSHAEYLGGKQPVSANATQVIAAVNAN